IDMAWVSRYEAKIYFVRKGELFIWDINGQKAENGYPMKIYGSQWEKKFPAGVSACFQVNEQAMYFFAGGRYYRTSVGRYGLGDYQNGGAIGENSGFGPLWPNGVDAVTDWDGRNIYFFKNQD